MQLLLCPSDYFRIEYEINPWMKISNNANTSIVQEQYAQLKKRFLDSGIEVLEIEADQRYPDMVYTANYGFVQDNKFIKANFKYPQRQGEEALAVQWFEQQGYDILTFPGHIHFEGEGDLLCIGDRYFMGYGKRTMLEAKPYLENLLEYPIIELELVDPYYYHLDTCFAPLKEDLVIINPQSFTTEGLKTIRGQFKNVIETLPEDNKVLACNLIEYNHKIVVSTGTTSSFKEKLAKYGYSLLETPMDQYIKGGGSVKCCSLILKK